MTIRRLANGDCAEGWCPVERTLGVIGGSWKLLIIRELLPGTRRYGAIHRAIDGVTHKMLTQQLRELERDGVVHRELERDGVVHREVFSQVPPKVEYSLTAAGRQLTPILQAMHSWGSTLGTGAAPFIQVASQAS